MLLVFIKECHCPVHLLFLPASLATQQQELWFQTGQCKWSSCNLAWDRGWTSWVLRDAVLVAKLAMKLVCHSLNFCFLDCAPIWWQLGKILPSLNRNSLAHLKWFFFLHQHLFSFALWDQLWNYNIQILWGFTPYEELHCITPVTWTGKKVYHFNIFL